VGSWFEGFVVRNTVAQSKFNFETRFRKYNFLTSKHYAREGDTKYEKKIRLFETRVICPLSSLKQFEETNHTNEKNKIWVIQALWSHKWSKRANHSKITRNRIWVKQDLKSLKLCNTSVHLHATQTTRTKADDIK